MKQLISVGLLVALFANVNLQAQDSGHPPGSAAASDTERPKGEEDQKGRGDTESLAKASQNPISDLISVPFQNNFNFGIGPDKVTQYLLNFQPVIPLHLNEDWNLITRTIVPVINQPSPGPDLPSAFGMGDINPTFFLSPAKPSHFIWGAGPTFTFPTATEPLLGNGMYLAGPSIVIVVDKGHWLGGALMNNQWSYAGWRHRNVNEFLTQPFVNYNLPKGWYLVANPIVTADWMADSANRWTVPVGGGAGKIIKLGDKLPPVNLQLTGYYNAVTPEVLGPKWQLRFEITFLFPTKK